MLSRSAAADPVKRRAPTRVLPGFKITLGYTLMYLCLIVLIPLSALVFKTFTLTWDQFWDTVTGPRVMASYRLTFGASLIAALVNVVFGLLVAWVLVRYQFFGKKIVDALVDLPFALPTAVAGISLTALLAGNGWVGQYLEPMGIQLAFNANGIVIGLIFIGLPFVVRTVQPVLEDAEKELEEAATCLGASRWQTFWYVTLPNIKWGLIYGVILCNARAMGEFGAVSVVSGHIRGQTNTMPLHVEILYNEYQSVAAFAVASLLALLALVTLVIKSVAEWRHEREMSALTLTQASWWPCLALLAAARPPCCASLRA